jgi:hypothetical protein
MASIVIPFVWTMMSQTLSRLRWQSETVPRVCANATAAAIAFFGIGPRVHVTHPAQLFIFLRHLTLEENFSRSLKEQFKEYKVLCLLHELSWTLAASLAYHLNLSNFLKTESFRNGYKDTNKWRSVTKRDDSLNMINNVRNISHVGTMVVLAILLIGFLCMPVVVADNVTQNTTQMVNTTPLSISSAPVTPTNISVDDQMQKINTTPHYLKPGTDLVPYNAVNYPSYGYNSYNTAYEANLTYPYNQTRFRSLLRFLDTNYPDREMKMQIYVMEGTVVPADQAATRFNITSNNGKPVGDQLLMEIDLDPGISTHIVDPYMTSVEYRSPENITCLRPDGKCVVPDIIGVSGWVDTNNLESLATLSGVKKITFIQNFGGHSGEEIPTGSTTANATTVLTGTPATPTTTKSGMDPIIPAGALVIGCLIPILLRKIPPEKL